MQCDVHAPPAPERVLSSTQQQPLWEVLGLQKWAPCGCGCGPQKGQSPGQKVRSTNRHTRNPEEGPGRQVPDGDTQGGLLEKGMSELASRTDRFDNEGGSGDIPGRATSPCHKAPNLLRRTQPLSP